MKNFSLPALFTALLFFAVPALAQKVLGEAVKDLATQISGSIAKQQKTRIAVVPFRELDGRTTVLGTYLAEELVTNLFMIGNLDIIERAMLDKVIGELKLGSTGAIDPETAKKVGKIAGVEAIVTGSITDLQSYVGINCRLIDTETGRIFGAAQTKIVKDDDVKKIMTMPVTPAQTTSPARASAPAAGEKKAATWQYGTIHVTVESMRKSGTVANVVLVYENSGSETARADTSNFYLLDDNGDRWEEAWSHDSHNINLIPGTRVRKTYTFNGKSNASGQEFTLIEEGREPNIVLRRIRPE